jgi:TPR repeat protein
MKDFYEPRKFEFDEEKFNESLVLADQDNPGGSFSKMMEWSEAIGYVARAYWAHFKDEKKTFQLLLKSAALGDPEAQYHLAFAFKKGKGTPLMNQEQFTG